MANELFNQLGNQGIPGEFGQLINEVKNFQNTFKGNPKQEVEKLIQSGKLSQDQFNQYAQIANQILPYIG